jgi:hypothetical protein
MRHFTDALTASTAAQTVSVRQLRAENYFFFVEGSTGVTLPPIKECLYANSKG